MTNPIPEADQFGFVKTLNNTGYMTTYLEEFSETWATRAAQSEMASADIGAAYGVATFEALKKGAKKIYAIDIDPGHLEALKQKVKSLEVSGAVECIAAKFPDVKGIADSSLSNILICRVLHFFDGPTIEKSIEWCYQKLAQGGALFLVNETPYLGNFKTFIPIYEERRKNEAAYPGFIEDVKVIAPERAKFLPPQMHLLDADVLSRVCEKFNFKIERTAFIPRPNFPTDIQLDGRESVGVIARKM